MNPLRQNEFMYKKFSAFLLVSFLAACSEKPKLQIIIPDSLDPAVKSLAIQSWPKIKNVCPGLDRFSGGLEFQGIEDNRDVSIIFKIPEGDSEIPGHYGAAGHTCYFDVSHDGKNLTVAKEGCKAICLSRSLEKNDPLQNGDLVLPLETNVQVDVVPEKPAFQTTSIKASPLRLQDARHLAENALVMAKKFEITLYDETIRHDDQLIEKTIRQPILVELNKWPSILEQHPDDTRKYFADCGEALAFVRSLSLRTVKPKSKDMIEDLSHALNNSIRSRERCEAVIDRSKLPDFEKSFKARSRQQECLNGCG